MAKLGRPATCDCGECEKCKHREYMRGWYARQRPAPLPERKCAMCGKTFLPKQETHIYDRRSCKQRAVYWRQHSTEGNVCQACGKDLSHRRRGTKWCDQACSRAAHPQRFRDNVKRSRLKKQYGMTLEDYAVMLERQGGGCAICGTTEIRGFGARQAVDHCHASSRVRGILCGNCNRGIGNFNHDPALLAAAMTYLKET
jgi:hypothetical protein